MACAVARGVPWMGRHTEPGLVIYLAAESPASVRLRLQAYQQFHNVSVPNLVVVQNPIDLFGGDFDAERIVRLIKALETGRDQKVRMVIGDTLDRIRMECDTHFCLIHHSGKSASAGARGWSGIRAAVDTEIEISESPSGRCCEITKQRDLSTKGERIGFRLDTVLLGTTKWGAAATSCIVLPSKAPDRKSGMRANECAGAVLEFLAGQSAGVKKTVVVRHFAERYSKGPIYRAMKMLLMAGAIHEAAGMVAAARESK